MTFREGVLLVVLCAVVMGAGLGFILYLHEQRLDTQNEINNALTEHYQRFPRFAPERPAPPPKAE